MPLITCRTRERLFRPHYGRADVEHAHARAWFARRHPQASPAALDALAAAHLQLVRPCGGWPR